MKAKAKKKKKPKKERLCQDCCIDIGVKELFMKFKTLSAELDGWKESESACSKSYDKLLEENDVLKIKTEKLVSALKEIAQRVITPNMSPAGIAWQFSLCVQRAQKALQEFEKP